MKINQEIKSNLDPSKIQAQLRKGSNVSFQQTVNQEKGKLQEAQLQQFMKDLTAQGEKVARFRSFQDLARYKRMVRQFIDEAVHNGLSLEQSRNWSMNGQQQNLTVIKQIDDHLIQLTDDLLDEQKSSIDILDVIGEIKGLLLNLQV